MPWKRNITGNQKSDLSVLLLPSTDSEAKPASQKRAPRRFTRNHIPDSILNDPSFNAAISLLPPNYNFELHKCVWRVRSTSASRVALQLPEGLLMYSLILSDIISTFGGANHCFVLGNATYGAYCFDDLVESAFGADLLIHYGHSCLIPVNLTVVPCLYVFVEISIDTRHLVRTVELSLPATSDIVLAGTTQFVLAIRAAKLELEGLDFRVLIPGLSHCSPEKSSATQLRR